MRLVAAILMVISTIVSMVFRPRPIPPAAAALSDFNTPTAEAGRPIPEVIGTVLITGPNEVWAGDLYVEPIPAPPVSSSGGGS